MKNPAHGIPYGIAPWHQVTWDARAAGNFIGGGIGAGTLAMLPLAGPDMGATGVLALIGLAFVLAGLGSVALELGRPFRALNVFRNPRTSWMSREALAGVVLGASVLAFAGGIVQATLVVALPALAFMYCQARLLNAARGIPAWDDRHVVPFIVATALAEGTGLLVVAAAFRGTDATLETAALAVLVAARTAIWHGYMRSLERTAPRARQALRRAGRGIVFLGGAAPLALLLTALALASQQARPLLALAGFGALAAGAYAKYAIVTRAGFNRGFHLPVLPVRGGRP